MPCRDVSDENWSSLDNRPALQKAVKRIDMLTEYLCYILSKIEHHPTNLPLTPRSIFNDRQDINTGRRNIRN